MELNNDGAVETRNQFPSSEPDTVLGEKVLFDSREVWNWISPYRFRVCQRLAPAIGWWISVEELIDDQWFGFVFNNNVQLQNTYLELALLNGDGNTCLHAESVALPVSIHTSALEAEIAALREQLELALQRETQLQGQVESLEFSLAAASEVQRK